MIYKHFFFIGYALSKYLNNTPVYNFLIKNAVQDFLLYNEFDQNITKDSDPVRQTYYTMKKL